MNDNKLKFPKINENLLREFLNFIKKNKSQWADNVKIGKFFRKILQ